MEQCARQALKTINAALTELSADSALSGAALMALRGAAETLTTVFVKNTVISAPLQRQLNSSMKRVTSCIAASITGEMLTPEVAAALVAALRAMLVNTSLVCTFMDALGIVYVALFCTHRTAALELYEHAVAVLRTVCTLLPLLPKASASREDLTRHKGLLFSRSVLHFVLAMPSVAPADVACWPALTDWSACMAVLTAQPEFAHAVATAELNRAVLWSWMALAVPWWKDDCVHAATVSARVIVSAFMVSGIAATAAQTVALTTGKLPLAAFRLMITNAAMEISTAACCVALAMTCDAASVVTLLDDASAVTWLSTVLERAMTRDTGADTARAPRLTVASYASNALARLASGLLVLRLVVAQRELRDARIDALLIKHVAFLRDLVASTLLCEHCTVWFMESIVHVSALPLDLGTEVAGCVLEQAAEFKDSDNVIRAAVPLLWWCTTVSADCRSRVLLLILHILETHEKEDNMTCLAATVWACMLTGDSSVGDAEHTASIPADLRGNVAARAIHAKLLEWYGSK